MSDGPDGSATQSRLVSATIPARTREAWCVWCGFVGAIVGHATGVFGQALYPLIVMASSVAALCGLRRVRPSQRWPWRTLIVVGVLWSIAGAVRQFSSATGDLSPSRSLLPDVFAFPGYVLFVVAMFGLVNTQRMERDRGLFIDALLIAIGSASVVFAMVITPTLQLPGASRIARVAIAIYPGISLWLMIAVVQLAFGRGRGSQGLFLVVSGSVCLMVGDIVFALGEIGSLDVSRNLLDVPYLMVAACLVTAALLPDIHRSVVNSPFEASQFDSMRLFALGVAFVAPIVAVSMSSDVGSGRAVQLVLLSCTAGLAVGRIAVIARSENEARAQLFRRATHDSLTGLPSRELLLDRATGLLANPQMLPVSMMFLDVDEFKMINDSMGHVAGDLLLIEVAGRLAATVRETDVVGRIGGDEFVVVTVDLDADGAHALGERIRRAMRAPFVLGSDEVFVSVSIGITMAATGTSANVLMQEADTAMYRSKDQGRSQITMFDASMRDSLVRRVDLEHGLRRALELNEVSVVYQPIVDTTFNHVYGLEALIRWTTPEMSYAPDEFMDVAEDSGLIVSLGAFVMDEACRQVALWRRTIPGAHDLIVSVNVSPRQVQASHLVDSVADILVRHELPGSALYLEITESVMLDDTVTTAAVLNGLRELGVRLAVDDFGTGFSALNYLRSFPVSCVKIDRSFVADLVTDSSAQALVKAVVALSRAMRLSVVAEGVETAEQAQRLADMGCTNVQGFLYARPMVAGAVPDLLHTIEGTPSTVVSKKRRSDVCSRS